MVKTQGNAFYVTGGTLPGSAECYVERSADSELLEGVLAGEYVYVLDARQMGKSSLSVRTIGRLNGAGVTTVFLDLTKFGVRNLTPEQWFAALLLELGRGLKLASQMSAYWKTNCEVPPVRRFFGALQDVALTEITGSIAVFIDEIDVTRSLPFDTDEFFAAIRQCFVGRATDPRLSRLSFVLFGTASPAELIQDTRVSPFNIGRRVDLEDFRYEEALVLAKRLPGDSAATLRRVLHWTSGHPYLTQRMCQLTEGQDGGANVDALCRQLFFDHRTKESDDNLAFVRNRLLKNDVDLVGLLEILDKVQSGKNVPDEASSPICSVLKLSGVVRVREGRLKMRNRIYAKVFDRQWIRNHLPDAEKRRQRASYRRGLWRATTVWGAATVIVAALATYGFTQARIAREELFQARNLAASLRMVQHNSELNWNRFAKEYQLAEAWHRSAQRAHSGFNAPDPGRTLSAGRLVPAPGSPLPLKGVAQGDGRRPGEPPAANHRPTATLKRSDQQGPG